MDNTDNFTLIANALYNKKGVVKLVELESGIWHSINISNVLNYDYNELVNFQKIFSLAVPGDNQIMLSKKMALSLMEKFKEKGYQFKEDIVKNDNFQKIVEIVLSGEFFNGSEVKALANTYQNILSSYQSTLINEISKKLFEPGKRLDSNHVFYKLSKESQAKIVMYVLEHSLGKEQEKTSLQQVVEIFGTRDASSLIEDYKSFPFIKKVFFSNYSYAHSRVITREHLEVYVDFFKYDLQDMHINAIIKDALTNRYVDSLVLLKDYYPDLLSQQLNDENYYKLVSGLHIRNSKIVIEFMMDNFSQDIWSNGCHALKSLYHENKANIVEQLLNAYPFNYEQYLLFKEVLFKRGEKTSDKMSDFAHFEKCLEVKALEAQLEKEAPRNSVVEKKLKF